MNKISQWFRKLTSTGEVPTSVGTVIELTESKMIVSVNGNNYAFPLPNEKRVEIHDRVLVDSISESVIEIIPHKNVAPIGTLYDNKRGFPFPFTMDDIAGMDDIKERIKQEICLPFSDEEHIKLAKMLKISPPSGLLLEGPPGCGKTMLASAIAEYMKLPMLTITSSDVISSLIGESSQNVAKIFRYCREHAPIILFIDEIESLSPKRGQERETGEIDRFYTQLLIELDGINARNTKKKYNIEKNVPNTEENAPSTVENKQSTKDNLSNNGNEETAKSNDAQKSHKMNELYSNFIFVIGATNRKDLVDPALLRPGRLDIHIKIPLPEYNTRFKIISKMLNDVPHKVNIQELSFETNGYSGADLSRLIQIAKISAVKDKKQKLSQSHFQEALRKITVKNSNSSMALIIANNEETFQTSDNKNFLISLFIKHFGKYLN